MITVESLVQEYARRYSAHNPRPSRSCALYPFLAVRGGAAIHLGDRDALRNHFATIMDAYRGAGATNWSPVEIETYPLGEHAAFATVRRNAVDPNGKVLRDMTRTYHLLADADSWRFLSYTNHF